MYNTYYLILFLYAFSRYSDLWNFSKWELDEKNKQRYYNRPILKPTSLSTMPEIVRKTNRATKHPIRFKGWKKGR